MLGKKIILTLQSLVRGKSGQIRLAIFIDVGDFLAGPRLNSITSVIDSYILMHFVDTVSSHVSKSLTANNEMIDPNSLMWSIHFCLLLEQANNESARDLRGWNWGIWV